MPSIKEVYKQQGITDRKQIIEWGKFAGESVQDVLDNDPGYFLWLDTHTNIPIESNILTEAEDNMKPDHEFKGWTERPEKWNGEPFDGNL